MDYLSAEAEGARKKTLVANKHIDNNQTYFFAVNKETFDKRELSARKHHGFENRFMFEKSGKDELPTRFDTLRVINLLLEVEAQDICINEILAFTPGTR